MAIVKGPNNAQLAINVAAVQNQIANTLEELIFTPPLDGVTLNGIQNKDIRMDSELVTMRNDIRSGYSSINDSNLGAISLVQRAGTNRTAPLSVGTHTVCLTPFGIHQITTADGSGLDVDPRVGLALPTSKLKHWMDWDNKLYNNYAAMTSRAIAMSNSGIQQPERLTALYAFTSVLGFYQSFVNQVSYHIDYIKDVQSKLGMEPMHGYLINDEKFQMQIGEIIHNISGYPALDTEYHEMINELSKRHLGKSKSLETPAIHNVGLVLGTTPTTIDLDAVSGFEVLPIEKTDTHWTSTLSEFGEVGAVFGLDRIMYPGWLADILFTNDPDATMKAEFETIMDACVTHTAKLGTYYRNVVQYLNYAKAKNWITFGVMGDYIQWNVESNGDIVYNPAPVTYSHTLNLLLDYAPRQMSYEGSNNDSWINIFCPLLLGSAGHSVDTRSIIQKLAIFVDDTMHDKSATIDELASWALWMVNIDGRDAIDASTGFDNGESSFINPISALQIVNSPIVMNVNAAGNVINRLSSLPLLYVLEDNDMENGYPFPIRFDTATNYRSSSDVATNSLTVGFIREGESDFFDFILGSVNSKVCMRLTETEAGTFNYLVYKTRPYNGLRLIRTSSGSFKRAAGEYVSALTHDVSDLQINKITQ